MKTESNGFGYIKDGRCEFKISQKIQILNTNL